MIAMCISIEVENQGIIQDMAILLQKNISLQMFDCWTEQKKYELSADSFFLACPAGTFKSVQDPGDKRSCQPCPLKYQTSKPGSSSPADCKCKAGYSLKHGR